MASDYDQLTVQYEEDGQVLVEQMDKVVLNKGQWTTVLFLYRERDRGSGQFGPAKAGLRRYQKVAGQFRKRDAINFSAKTAPMVVEQLRKWFELA
ncbi:MAG: hypothetical protein C4525_13970 [Desulfarculus sp.]|nr:MAG: hypothetical protein C4525_13970 [Desulfarculus sp.]